MGKRRWNKTWKNATYLKQMKHMDNVNKSIKELVKNNKEQVETTMYKLPEKDL